MLHAEIKHPRALSQADIEAWRGFCAAEPDFRSPLLGPDFALLVGEVRPDARVAVFQRDGRTIGFLAFHGGPGGVARPIGAAFSDYHALVSAPGEHIDGPEALAAARIGSLHFTGLIDPHGSFRTAPCAAPGYLIEPGPDVEAHLNALRDVNPKRFKNWRRLQNKLEREWGPVEINPADTSPAAFEQLLAWKRDQYRRTGSHDMLRPAWTRALFRRAFETPEGGLRGIMSTLSAGGKLVAGHFGVAVAGVGHIWISSMDPACAACGPGLVLMLHTAEVMKALDLTAYDLGPSHDHYKAPFATGTVMVGAGLAAACGVAGLAARSLNGAWTLAGDGRVDAVGRLRRRLDHIASAETSMGGKVRGMFDALTGLGRRNASRDHGRAVPEGA